MHSECARLSGFVVSPDSFSISGAQRSGSFFLYSPPHLAFDSLVGPPSSYSNDGLFLPLSFLFVCVHPEVSRAERPCAEDPALAVGGAPRGSASPPTGRRESRCPTHTSSSRQIGERVLCQVGRTVLLALLLGQGASGTRASPSPSPGTPFTAILSLGPLFSSSVPSAFPHIRALATHTLPTPLVSTLGSLGLQFSFPQSPLDSFP